MKFRNLILPCLFALGLCSCGLKVKKVTDVIVEVSQKERKTGESFDVNDIKATLNYGDSDSKTVAFKDFGLNSLSAFYSDPEGKKTLIINKGFSLDYVGTYTIDVTYTPSSRYSFPSTGTDFFEVVENIIPATSITLSSDSMSLKKGFSEQISYSILPSNSTTKVASFESNDINVATVDDSGLVTAVEEGQCIIKVVADNVYQECLVTVSPSSTLDYVFESKDFTSSSGNWTYDNEGNSLDSRQNRGVCIGEKTSIVSPISFDSVYYVSYECFTGSNSSISSSSGEIASVETYVNDELFDTKQLTSYNNSFKGTVKINDVSGFVKLVINPEKSKVYIRSISVSYDENPIYPTAISLSGNSTLGVGDTDKITISYTPANTNKRVIEWTSSNENVLVVGRDGSISGVSEGTAVVQAKASTESGTVNGGITINVVKIPIESMELSSNELDVYKGSSKTLTVSIKPSNTSDKRVSFESNNPNIATVDTSGNVTGVSVGTCKITCKSLDNPTVIAICNINVLEKPVLKSQEMSSTMKDLANKHYYSIDSAPSIGTLKLLVIPVWFTDSSTYISSKENVRSDIQKVYFGSTSDTGWESVKTFYETEANGKLTLEGTVSEWYECGKNLNTYNYDSSSTNNATSNLVKNATDWYFNNHSSDSRKNYDYDGDGFIDGVILIYGAPDCSAFESQSPFSRVSYGDNLWAYTYWLQNSSYKNVSNPGPNAYFWASYDFMYNSSTAKSRTGKSTYASGVNNSILKIDGHTFIHEMGHIFGLEDYYDYSGYYNPAGGFSMQDYNVGGHDPFSCLSLGWAKAFVPIESGEITLKPFQSSHEVVLLSPSFNSYNSPFDEYLLLELYTPTGLNKYDTEHQYNYQSPTGINATGIRLWHVDARLIKYNNRGDAITSTTYDHIVDDCDLMMSNTYYSTSTVDYISPCGKNYADYNLLQLIRNSTTATYQPKDSLMNDYLFKNNSSFNMNLYKKQFKQSGKLNSGKDLGWEFSVSIAGSSEDAVATITLVKK